MQKKISQLLLLFLFSALGALGQIPTNPNYFLQTPQTCTGTPIYNMINVSMTNECSVQLSGYPFTAKYNLSGAIMNTYNDVTGSKTTCGVTGIWGYTLGAAGATNFTIRPGYGNTIWRGENMLCCPVDTMPGDLGINGYGNYSYGGSVTTANGSFNPPIKATFTITNPYGPKFTLQGKNLDMNHTELIAKCGAGANQIPLVNLTNAFGTTVHYYVTIYNSDANKTQGSVFSNTSTWSATVPSYLDVVGGLLASPTNGNYYIIKLSARSSCSSGSGSYALGHFRYVTPPTPTAGFTINSTTVPTSCTTPLQTYNCTSFALALDNTSTNSSQYKVELFKSTTACGTYTSVYNSDYVSVCPTDLKNLPTGVGGVSGTYIQSNPGFYKIVFTTKNACNVVSATSQTGYFNVASPPSAGTVVFTTNTKPKSGQTYTIGGCTVPSLTQFNYYDGVATCGGAPGYNFPMQHTSFLTPDEVGISANVAISVGGTGSSSFTPAFFIDKWSGTDWVSMSYTNALGQVLGYVTPNSTSESIADLCYDDALNPNNDIINTSPAGTIFRIKTVVTNACGSFTNYEIIRKNTGNLKRMANPNATNGSEEEKLEKDFAVYPNPFSDKIFFQLSSQEELKYKTIEIVDITGKIVYCKNISTETGLLEIETNKFSSGIYLYKLINDEKVTSGKIIKQ